MAIITIFSGSFCNENPVIEETISRTGYRLITDNANASASKSRKAHDDVCRIFFMDFEKGIFIDDAFHHFPHIIRMLRIFGDDVLKLLAVFCIGSEV